MIIKFDFKNANTLQIKRRDPEIISSLNKNECFRIFENYKSICEYNNRCMSSSLMYGLPINEYCKCTRSIGKHTTSKNIIRRIGPKMINQRYNDNE